MKWEIGMTIIAIKDQSNGLFKKGDEFIIQGLKKTHCGCGNILIDIGKITNVAFRRCKRCTITVRLTDNIAWFSEKAFVPKILTPEISEKDVEELIQELENTMILN